MNEINASQLLEQMRNLVHEAQGKSNKISSNSPTHNFGDVLMEQINKVNDVQMDSHNKQTKYVLGDSSITLPQVMVATQKSGVYTQFLVETRNKVVEAYNQIMNMPV